MLLVLLDVPMMPHRKVTSVPDRTNGVKGRGFVIEARDLDPVVLSITEK